jgi:hypothetical protein
MAFEVEAVEASFCGGVLAALIRPSTIRAASVDGDSVRRGVKDMGMINALCRALFQLCHTLA